MDELPWVPLGLRTSPKEDINSSTAELVYGEALTLPGEFVLSNPGPHSSTTGKHPFLAASNKFIPSPTSNHSDNQNTVSRTLRNASFVFVRYGSQRGPLQRPYSGPYRVIASGDKTFKVRMGGRDEVISIDRLKPAYVDTSQPVTTAQPPLRGRPSGRRVVSYSQDRTDKSPPKMSRAGRVSQPPPRYGYP